MFDAYSVLEQAALNPFFEVEALSWIALRTMSNAAIDNSSHMANNYHDMFSQPSTASSPFNSFTVEYDIIDTMTSSKEPINRLKEITSSSAFSKHNNNNNSAMQPPPAQLMASTGVYDPNRIPGSAFSSKYATPVDWSVASNESLFSIQTGNASFNRDHPAFYRKSQELTKYDDTINPPSDLPHCSGSVDADKQHIVLNHTALPGTLEDEKTESTGDRPCAELSSSSTSSNSDGRNSGAQPFSFPILDNLDTRNSLGKLSPGEINKQGSCVEAPKKTAEDAQAVMNSPVPAAKNTNWFSFYCCQR